MIIIMEISTGMTKLVTALIISVITVRLTDGIIILSYLIWTDGHKTVHDVLAHENVPIV